MRLVIRSGQTVTIEPLDPTALTWQNAAGTWGVTITADEIRIEHSATTVPPSSVPVGASGVGSFAAQPYGT